MNSPGNVGKVCPFAVLLAQRFRERAMKRTPGDHLCCRDVRKGIRTSLDIIDRHVSVPLQTFERSNKARILAKR